MCAFKEGDKVEVAGRCGTVVRKRKLGNGYILRVEFEDGTRVSVDCEQARGCR